VNATSFVQPDNRTPSCGAFGAIIRRLVRLTRSLPVHTTGHQDCRTQHYDDFIDLWRNIQYHPLLWLRDVEKNVRRGIDITP